MTMKSWITIGLVGVGIALGPVGTAADLYSVKVSEPSAPPTNGFKMGTARRPDGTTLTLDRNSLLLEGKPWTPVMGEFHFSRYPDNEWRGELLKMKAGGV